MSLVGDDAVRSSEKKPCERPSRRNISINDQENRHIETPKAAFEQNYAPMTSFIRQAGCGITITEDPL